MSITVHRSDRRFASLAQGFNLRWPAHSPVAPTTLELCRNAADIAVTLQEVVDRGTRPTIRSGGHCYEDFVANNPGGTIIDVGMFAGIEERAGGGFIIRPGTQNWDGYLAAYRKYGVGLPGGSCYSVGAGGHVAGGGFGLLSRLQGLTVDWLDAVDILIVDERGAVQPLTVDRHSEPELFRACRGSGGGQWGIVTGFGFAQLPTPPREVGLATIAFDWADMTRSRFQQILQAFGDYWAGEGQLPHTWGLFAALKLTHRSAGQFTMFAQFCQPDGSADDVGTLQAFLDRFADCRPVALTLNAAGYDPRASTGLSMRTTGKVGAIRRYPWLVATQTLNGSGPNRRGAYKSAHMRSSFSVHEMDALYDHLVRPEPAIDLSQAVIQIDSYGGAINVAARASDTAVWQRASVMKLQYQAYWDDSADDERYTTWLSRLYTDVYTSSRVAAAHAGTPYANKWYEGCYINYPDRDMLRHAFWPELFYGPGEAYARLRRAKRRYDPNNIFHHAMSVQP